ncbi:hypothetical protein [Acidithiobacillus caldus]|uniref:Uncharacterized protein n=1 Tax=Acidithiobacillus caldus TaxID=33059 RepID=A0A1E7YNA8_9PROT|nr:hypothetical protein [Acidithiobacillus caldus]OFC36609.1 hypothetical protein BAE27_05950 [Acidithiobacillus caldus]OFC38223.1 hypothetical protein BAE29_09205 [Acidithiobacillus caldus]OFC39319.1 hypothetical protein BAE28_03880 [Acidithiobacillus caldus]OFC50180.1 hypothetical protein BAE30_13000 [Acidithiobacillus caldus]
MKPPTEQIRVKLEALFPGHQPIAYVYAAAKVEAAFEMAVQKVTARGLRLTDLPSETLSLMVDWSIRLAFGPHTKDADREFFTKALGGNS